MKNVEPCIDCGGIDLIIKVDPAISKKGKDGLTIACKQCGNHYHIPNMQNSEAIKYWNGRMLNLRVLINQQKDMPQEFVELVNKNFWELIEK